MSDNKELSENLETKTKKVRTVNAFVMLFSIIAIVSILSYFIPAGEYQREMVNGREVVVQGTYETMENTPIAFFRVFTSIYTGMEDAASIIFYVLIIGGTFGVLTASGSVDAFIGAIARKFGNKDFVFIAIIMFVLSLGGAFLSMCEEALIYIPLVLPFILALGFDSVTAAAVVLMGMSVGFTTAILNPFTVGLAQGIAGLPLFSGVWYRVCIYVVMLTVTILYVYRYAKKVKKDPSKGHIDPSMEIKSMNTYEQQTFTKKHKLIMFSLALCMITIAFGTGQLGWSLGEMSGVFIIYAIVMGLIQRCSCGQLVDNFLSGMQGMCVGALAIGIARGIVVVMSEGHMTDTLLYNASGILNNFSPAVCIFGMFVLQALIHFFVPSGSAQAMLTMPIMLPLGELVGITHQTTCLIFTLADGTGNVIFPTVGAFIGVLAITKIPYQVWVKKMGPLVLIQYCISIIAVLIANSFGYGPF